MLLDTLHCDITGECVLCDVQYVCIRFREVKKTVHLTYTVVFNLILCIPAIQPAQVYDMSLPIIFYVLLVYRSTLNH